MSKKEVYHTLRLVSKPIYFLGLPPLYIIGVALLFLLISFFLVLKLGMGAIVLCIPILILIVTLLGKLAKEQKKGCPDILSSYFVKLSTKERYSDQSFLLNYLRK